MVDGAPLVSDVKSMKSNGSSSKSGAASPTSAVVRSKMVRKSAETKISVGDRVSATGKKGNKATETQEGIVRFLGKTAFAEGDWVGIELDFDGGKNDGSVAGKSYFSCPPNRGIFHKLTNVTKLEGQDAPPAAGRLSGPRAGKAGAKDREPSSGSASPKRAPSGGSGDQKPTSPKASGVGKGQPASPQSATPVAVSSPAEPESAPEAQRKYEASKMQYQQLKNIFQAAIKLRETVEGMATHAASVNDVLGDCEEGLNGNLAGKRGSIRASISGASSRSGTNRPAAAAAAAGSNGSLSSSQALLRARALQVAHQLQEQVCSNLENNVATVVTAAVEAGTAELLEAAAAARREATKSSY